MAEPITIATTVKAVGESIAAVWVRGALIFWCATAVGVVVLSALLLGAYTQLGDAPALLASHGTWIALATLVLAVVAGFKTYAERAARPLVLIADEQQSRWQQATQPSGQVLTMLVLHFQATNVSKGDVMPSAIRLRKPWVRRHSILRTWLATRHPTGDTYSREHPILANRLSYCHADITIDHAIGKVGRPMRVVIKVQDHAGQWYRLVFPRLRSI